MTDWKPGDVRKLYCNTCRGLTRHELLYVYTRTYSEVYDGPEAIVPEYWERYLYRLWACRGCDTVTLEETWNAMDMEDEAGNIIWDARFYPKRAKSDLSVKRFEQLSLKLASIYREIIESFNADSRILCAIGLRALLEGVCADKGIKGKNLEEKIEGLKKYLPDNIVNNLHEFRFLGNDAAHELESPPRSHLGTAISIMEDLLNFLYDLEYRTEWWNMTSASRAHHPPPSDGSEP